MSGPHGVQEFKSLGNDSSASSSTQVEEVSILKSSEQLEMIAAGMEQQTREVGH